MLDDVLKKRILDAVRQKPRSIDELATLIRKNWRTADRYVQRIAETEGSISVRTFREGTRGALKIVFWVPAESIHSSEFQERLFKHIEMGRKKSDFSPSEIYQYVDEKKKDAVILTEDYLDSKSNFEDYRERLLGTKSELFLFSGNLSLVNMGTKKEDVADVLEKIAKRGVNIRILTRVEIPGIENIRRILEINNKVGKKMVDIRHCFHPLRGTIFDDSVAILKEIRKPEIYVKGELKEKMTTFYRIYDKEWIEWLKNVFWAMFRSSISAERRIEDISGMQTVKVHR